MPTPTFSAAQYEEDFLYLWQQVADDYCYPGLADWDQVRDLYRPAARACTSRAGFLAVLEQALDSLCDFHAQLGQNTASSPYPVPTYATCWAEWRAGRAFLTAVRPHSAAARAGLQAGQEVVAVDGQPVWPAAQALLGPATNAAAPAAQAWALLRLLTGRRGAAPQVAVRAAQHAPRVVVLEPGPEASPATAAPLLVSHRLGTAPALGYLRLHNSLGNEDLIAAFDAALTALLPTRGLLLDLRDTPSGGTTTVARAIIGRFTARELPYQKHVLPQEELRIGIRHSWLELVSPRALPVYEAPVVVLVDRWTGSMGEGLAVGLSQLAPRVQVVGTRMAGLRGAVTTYHLPHTQIPFTIPTEQLYTVAGLARELYCPPILVEDLAPTAAAADVIWHTGERVLRAAVQRLAVPAPVA